MWPMDCTETISWRFLLHWQGSKSHSCRTTRNFSFFNTHPGKPVEFFYLKNSATSTFKLLSEMQGDTTTRPEAYLDLGNEFSWAALKSRPSTLGLQGICSGESTEFYLPHRLFLLQKERETKKEIVQKRCLYSHGHPQHIPAINKNKKEPGNFPSGFTAARGCHQLQWNYATCKGNV